MLFIDYQNTYHAAREVFHDWDARSWEGQFHPGPLGEFIVEGSPFDRELVGVRIYRGLPSSDKDPKGYGAALSQIEAWKSHPRVAPTMRPLRYPDGWPDEKAEEKGIDVSIAVDFVVGAVKGAFDVGILMSLDTDLKPALEAVTGQLHGVRVEVAAWSNPDRRCRRLAIAGQNLWCHWIDEDGYRRVQDTTNYARRHP